MNHVQTSLCARKDGQISFLHCGGPVKLVKSCLSAGNTLQRCLNRRGVVKHVEACLSARKDGGDLSFHNC